MANIVSDKSKSLKSLYAVRDLIAPLANINFFIELGASAINYDDAQLANIIKADNYNKTLQKISDFARGRST